MAKHPVEELNLINDFLFNKIITNQRFGPEFGKILIKTILGKEVTNLKITAQASIYGADTTYHGIRMDVYLDEAEMEEESNPGQEIFDIEPETSYKEKKVSELPRRLRFYHSMIDYKAIQSGQTYDKLRNVWVILIMDYDPFWENRIIYTIQNQIVECPEHSYDDGACTLLLYTKGTEGSVPEELKALLLYFSHTVPENANNDSLRSIQRMVDSVKADERVREEYMKSWEIAALIKEEAHEQGHEEGFQEGHEEGFQQGHEEGFQEGHEEGFQQGHDEGLQQGRAEGRKEGRAEGRAEGIEEGRLLERADTEKERKRADEAEQRISLAEQEIMQLKMMIQQLKEAVAAAQK